MKRFLAASTAAAALALTPTASADITTRDWEPVVVRGHAVSGLAGTPTDQILVYAWRDGQLTQIPHQVDERLDRVLEGQGDTRFYSGTDLENTYDYDGTEDNGLDADDEIVFMAKDAGEQAPEQPSLEGGSLAYELEVTDPRTGEAGYVYVFTSSTIARDFEPYTTYVSAVEDIPYDRPRGMSLDDTVTTSGYRMHFSTRWALDEIRPRTGPDSFGVDLVDRWKGRAFFENGEAGGGQDENHWSRSQSQMLGSIAGPVRAIRESLGTNSGTNVTRTVIAYPHSFKQVIGLRVHPMPPLGMWGFWDMDSDAGPMTYYSELQPDGVPVDGRPDAGVGTGAEAHSQLVGYWQQVSGEHGGLATFMQSHKPVRTVSSIYYRDELDYNDGTGDDPAIGDGQGSYGSFGMNFRFGDDTDGVFVQQLGPVFEGVITESARVLGPNSPSLGADLAANQRNPFVIAATRPGALAADTAAEGAVYALSEGSLCSPDGNTCFPLSDDPVGTAGPPMEEFEEQCMPVIGRPCYSDLPLPRR